MTGSRTSSTAPDWDAIARYLAAESSASEAAEVRRWLEAHPADAKAIAALDAAIGSHAPRAQVDVEAALLEVKARTARRIPRWGIAAGALAAAAALVFLVVRRTADDPATLATPAVLASYATQPGARDTIGLPDGTRIMLGPSTRLAVSGRDVTLEGEAFFAMSEQKQGPYVVRANGATIRDIGTEFGVRAYPREPLRVVVSSGIVEVTSSGRAVVLDSADVGVMSAGGVVARSADAVSPDDVAWMQGRLVFRNASMTEVRADLLRWYGVELRVSDPSLQQRHFTGAFSGEPVGRVANVIALALGARAERRADTIFLHPARR
jgi:transmembrane sensor